LFRFYYVKEELEYNDMIFLEGSPGTPT